MITKIAVKLFKMKVTFLTVIWYKYDGVFVRFNGEGGGGGGWGGKRSIYRDMSNYLAVGVDSPISTPFRSKIKIK